ncbi:MAG: hypothetical protein AAFX46_17480, partial [Cyanobacteria bacterium J06636_27]
LQELIFIFYPMTQTDERLNRVEVQLSQLAEAQLQTQTSVKQMSNRIDEFVFQAQRLLSQQAGRLINVEGQTERFEAVIRKLDRNYEEQKSSLNEYRKTTNATLERIDRILDYLVKGSGNSENS